MDLMPLLVDAMLAPHTHLRSHGAALRTSVEETSDGWLVAVPLPGQSAADVRVETSVDADGDTHLWLHAAKNCTTELRCVRARAQ